MRALPILASLLLASPLARAATDLDLLQSRCAEQERQIKELEEKNARLESLLASSQKTALAEAPAAKPSADSSGKPAETSAPKSDKPASASYATVRKGDTLAAVARRNGTSADTLAKLNGIKTSASLRTGQKLRLPAPTAVAKKDSPSSPKSEAAPRGTHTVKQGETFYSIAKRYGISADSLQAANPGVKSTALRPGQTLQLQGKALAPSSAPAPKPTRSAMMAKNTPAKTTTPAPAASEAPKSKPAPEIAKRTESPAVAGTGATPAPAAESTTVANRPSIRSINLSQKTTYGAFAAAHGTSIEKLNALNGLSLASGTVLKEGSELYVPAQP